MLGNHKKYGVDYQQTFAPVAKMTTIQSLLSIAAIKHWHVHQMDVKNAFLHGDLFETVFMRPPHWLQSLGQRFTYSPQGELSSPKTAMVCNLKNLFMASSRLSGNGLPNLVVLSCIINSYNLKLTIPFLLKTLLIHITIILVYVDDLLITGSDLHEINNTKNFLHSQFHMKDLGHLRYFLGIEVDRTNQ